MTNKERFSKRTGHFSIKDKEITIREDAPKGLRVFIPMAFYNLGKNPSELRKIICRVLKTPPDRNNWSEYPNIEDEIDQLLKNCDWFLVYDVIETISDNLNSDKREIFENEINEYFIANGIGWKIENQIIETRGDEEFEVAIDKVESVLETAKLNTAQGEIKEALADLSRRPNPDITGAIQHSLACLECVAREATGDKKSTLGDLIKKHPGIIPTPLDKAVSKIWGYSSEQGRHLREGQVPEYIEAELIVEITAAISTYLGKKLGGYDRMNDEPDGLPL